MSVLGFPEELNFQSLKSMYPSRKTENRKAPMNSLTFTSAGHDIQLVLSKMENSFYDPQTLAVSFTVDYTGITAGAADADGSFLLGNAYSHFSRQVIRPLSGQPLETIDNPSLLVNAVLNMTTDTMEKYALSTSFGSSSKSDNFMTNLGALIDNDTTINTTTQSFTIPLIGCLNTSKLIPAFITDIEIDLTLNNISNFILAAGINPLVADAAVTGYSIKMLN